MKGRLRSRETERGRVLAQEAASLRKGVAGTGTEPASEGATAVTAPRGELRPPRRLNSQRGGQNGPPVISLAAPGGRKVLRQGMSSRSQEERGGSRVHSGHQIRRHNFEAWAAGASVGA